MLNKREIAYKNLIIRMVIISLTLSITLGVAASFYLKNRAVNEMARNDAKKTSELVFQSIYSAMAKGWNKEDLQGIIERLNKIEPNMTVNIYRSQKVAEHFGDIKRDSIARVFDDEVKMAMNGEELLLTKPGDTIRYLYPITAKEECLACHINSKVGEVNGVIDITYPISKVKVSLSLMLNSFLIFFAIFILAMFATLYFNLNRLLVKPIEQFIDTIREIIYRNDLTTRVHMNTRIKEVKNIETFFNKLLDSLLDYYEKLKELSDKDFLTKLYNRKKFEEFLGYEIGRATRHNYKFCVVMIDLDNFKFINDTYGHPSGDLVLREVSMIFESALRASDIIARIGGDEFAAILVDSDEQKAIEVVTRLKEELAGTDIAIPADKVRITASFGIIEFPLHGKELNALMTGADIAMYKAKKAGKNALALAEDDDAMISTEIYKTGEFIRKAIEEDRLLPFYQPIFDVSSGELYAYEVLARIKESDGDGFIGAAQFIETADHLDLTRKIDKIILEKAIAERQKSPNPEITLFLNLSGKAFHDSAFINDTMAIIERGGKDANKNIIFEITEREAVPNITEFIPLIEQMRKLGIRFALDDFGSGFSSFIYLKYLHVDIVKIDGAFVKNISANYKDEVFVRHIHEISNEFGKRTVAEYVEDAETMEVLKKIGVTYAQGFYLGMPSQKIL
jgi:c-di-GMP phosphodiesterase